MNIPALRARMIDEFLGRWFLLGGMPSSDTYKRTMWSASDTLAALTASYHLTLRTGLPETGAGGRLIAAGHEWLLRQWFYRPLQREAIETAIAWYTTGSAVRSFPVALFQQLLAEQAGDDIYLPIDVWGFPGGQTFLAGVPMLSLKGPGGIVSFLEPQLCRYFAPVIHATKGRLMYEVAGSRHAEFGYRSDVDEQMAVAKLLALFVGGGGFPISTSADVAEFMFPELFRAIGTLGHEFMGSLQGLDKGLDSAEREAMELFVMAQGRASLLTDLVDAETVGLENALATMHAHPDRKGIGARIDSGDITAQAVFYAQRLVAEGLGDRIVVFEDGVDPDKVREVQGAVYRAVPEAAVPFPGAGGYYNRGVHRDTVSAAFKRSATDGRPNTKFSPGKESIPGDVRVYAQGRTLIVADSSEEIDGEPLFVQLVQRGRIVNPEDMDFPRQAARANDTWARYDAWELSPLVASWRERFRELRTEAQARARVEPRG